jgi:hypothetical protein
LRELAVPELWFAGAASSTAVAADDEAGAAAGTTAFVVPQADSRAAPAVKKAARNTTCLRDMGFSPVICDLAPARLAPYANYTDRHPNRFKEILKLSEDP